MIWFILAVPAQENERVFMKFCERQCKYGRHIPSRAQYFRALHASYLIEHPVPQAWWKTQLANILNWITKD